MTISSRSVRWVAMLICGAAFALSGCSGESEQVAQARGAPSLAGGGGKAKAPSKRRSRRDSATEAAASEDGEEPVDEGPDRPPPTLDAKSFARGRDPFRSFRSENTVTPEVERPRGQRKVQMAQYAFEDLKLIAIVNSGRGILPRALFLASDGKSGTIRQGEYFSSAEVLLAAVNRDYVEIEVVDDDLASSLNLQRGERRALYLRNE